MDILKKEGLQSNNPGSELQIMKSKKGMHNRKTSVLTKGL
jgi:hypothetical protein